MAGVAKDFEKRDWLLVAAAATLIAGYLGIGHFSVESKAPWYDEKLAASQLAQRAMASVRAEKLARGIAIDRTADVNETGLIGLRSSSGVGAQAASATADASIKSLIAYPLFGTQQLARSLGRSDYQSLWTDMPDSMAEDTTGLRRAPAF